MSAKLRIMPLGGCGEVGKNMTIFEYEDEILIVDCGVMFPMSDMLGVETIIPDFNYLRDKWDRVRAVLVTHGHEDHIGAIGYLMANIPNVPLYATPLTMGLMQTKLRGQKVADRVKMKIIVPGDAFTIGRFLIEPFRVTHSIPDSVGFAITTPVGLVIHSGDYKFDHTPVDGYPPDFAKLAEFSARGVLCLLADSTNSTQPGWTPSEQCLTEAFKDLFQKAKGRIIVASFASLISRVAQVAEAARVTGRKFAVAGRTMRDNIKMAQKLGYLEFPDGMVMDANETSSLPDKDVVIMATGSQGEPEAVLSRLARGRHPFLTIREGDTVIISSHAIPGNDENISRIVNALMQKGADVFYEENSNVHVSGHASQEEMKLLLNLVRPKFFIPIHGELRHLRQHRQLAEEIGVEPSTIAVVENGTPVEFTRTTMKILSRLKGGYIFVQGNKIGEFGFPLIRQREKLAQAGFFAVSLRLSRSGELLSIPKYASSGFVSVDLLPQLIKGAEPVIRDGIKSYHADWKQLNSHLEAALERYFYQEMGIAPKATVIIHEGS